MGEQAGLTTHACASWRDQIFLAGDAMKLKVFGAPIALGAALCAFGLAGGASAAEALDANYTPSQSIYSLGVGNAIPYAQTFTVETTGLLTQAQLFAFNLGSNVSDGGMLLQVVKTAVDGSPSTTAGDVLGSAYAPVAQVNGSGGLVTFDFVDFAVSAGDLLALVVTSDASSGLFGWRGDFGGAHGADNGYAGGMTYFRNPTGIEDGHFVYGAWSAGLNMPGDPSLPDLGFKTFVDAAAAVPEPTSWALMIVGFGGMGAALRRRRAEPAAA